MSLVMILGGALPKFEQRLEDVLTQLGFDTILLRPNLAEQLDAVPFRLDLDVGDPHSRLRVISQLDLEDFIDEIGYVVWIGPPRLIVGDEVVQFRDISRGPSRMAAQSFLYQLRRHMSEGVPGHPRRLIMVYAAPRICPRRDNEVAYTHSQVLPLGWPDLFEALQPNQQFATITGLHRIEMSSVTGHVGDRWYYNIDPSNLTRAAMRTANLLLRVRDADE